MKLKFICRTSGSPRHVKYLQGRMNRVTYQLSLTIPEASISCLPSKKDSQHMLRNHLDPQQDGVRASTSSKAM